MIDIPDTLQRKYGPLPGYAWVGIGALAIVLVGSTVRGKGAAATSSAAPVNPDGTTANPELDDGSEIGGGAPPPYEFGPSILPETGFDDPGGSWWTTAPDDGFTWPADTTDTEPPFTGAADPQTDPVRGVLHPVAASFPKPVYEPVYHGGMAREALGTSPGTVSRVFDLPALIQRTEVSGFGALATPTPAPVYHGGAAVAAIAAQPNNNPARVIQTPQTPQAPTYKVPGGVIKAM